METKIYLANINILENGGKTLHEVQSRVGRELLSYAYREVLGEGKMPEIIYGPKGKPGFPDNKPFYFSLSHSGGLAGVLVSEAPVGFDIQLMDNRDYEKIAKRFFSPDEACAVRDKEDFFRIFTKKESFVKMTGEGMSRDFRGFSTISPSPELYFENELINFAGKEYMTGICLEISGNKFLSNEDAGFKIQKEFLERLIKEDVL